MRHSKFFTLGGESISESELSTSIGPKYISSITCGYKESEFVTQCLRTFFVAQVHRVTAFISKVLICRLQVASICSIIHHSSIHFARYNFHIHNYKNFRPISLHPHFQSCVSPFRTLRYQEPVHWRLIFRVGRRIRVLFQTFLSQSFFLPNN